MGDIDGCFRMGAHQYFLSQNKHLQPNMQGEHSSCWHYFSVNVCTDWT